MCQRCRAQARRKNRIRTVHILSDPDLHLSKRERATFIYNHLKYEFYSKLREEVDKRGMASVERLAREEEVVMLRTDPEYQDL